MLHKTRKQEAHTLTTPAFSPRTMPTKLRIRMSASVVKVIRGPASDKPSPSRSRTVMCTGVVTMALVWHNHEGNGRCVRKANRQRGNKRKVASVVTHDVDHVLDPDDGDHEREEEPGHALELPPEHDAQTSRARLPRGE